LRRVYLVRGTGEKVTVSRSVNGGMLTAGAFE
jgi:hypothetical protein